MLLSPPRKCKIARVPDCAQLVNQLLMIKPQDGCPISWLSNDCLFYILNMCRHDWCEIDDAPDGAAGGGKSSKV